MAFIAIWHMFIDLFALQHIADRPGFTEYPMHINFGASIFRWSFMEMWA